MISPWLLGQEGPEFALAEPDKLGRVRRLDGAAGRYMELVKASFPDDLRLDGMKVAVDCAHGAAYRIAPRILYELGADVIEHAVEPNGLNINQQCGATAPKGLRLKVLETGADIGLALDGDADRLIVVDEQLGDDSGCDFVRALRARGVPEVTTRAPTPPKWSTFG